MFNSNPVPPFLLLWAPFLWKQSYMCFTNGARKKVYFFLSWSRGVGDWGISTQLGKGWKTGLLFLFCFVFAACYQQDELILKVCIENKFWISSALVICLCPRPESSSRLSPNTQAPSFEKLTAEGAASLWLPRSQPEKGEVQRPPAHSARLKEGF